MLPHFQYIKSLYDEGHNNARIKLVIVEWLRINVGQEGNARNPLNDDKWAWSLTKYLDNVNPVGIYFKHSEDQLRFKLTLGGENYNRWYGD